MRLSKHRTWLGSAFLFTPVSVQPISTCQPVLGDHPSRKSLDNRPHIVHRPRLIAVFRSCAQLEIVDTVSGWYYSWKLVCVNKANKLSSHIINWSFVVSLVGSGCTKSEIKYFDDWNQVFIFKINVAEKQFKVWIESGLKIYNTKDYAIT